MNFPNANLWRKLQPILDRFAQKANEREPGLIVRVGSSCNDAFLLRAYVAFQRNDGCEEIAVTVDVQNLDGVLVIESDLCSDTGHIFKHGPVLRELSSDPQQVEELFDRWCVEFQRFLSDNEDWFLSL